MDKDMLSGRDSHYPDGLDDDVIEALLSEMKGHWAMSARSTLERSTSAFLDGSAALRRERRTTRRRIGAVVRALPWMEQAA